MLLAPEAEEDLAEAYGWYERRRVGLGEEFLSCVDGCIQGCLRSPRAHALAHETYRRALVRRFPYAVFYEYDAGADTVVVHGVFHTSRDPDKWRERLS